MTDRSVDSQHSFAIITPSYKPDFERCRLLCHSIKRFVQPPIRHYIAVEQRDFQLFSSLKGPNTEVIIVQDLLPRWIFRVPKFKKAWVSLKTLPVRNWIMQQITKIALARSVKEDVLLFLDSDEAFIRPFDCQSLIKDGLVRFYSQPDGNPANMETPHQLWHESASKLLGLPPKPMPAPDYIADVVIWKQDNVRSMCQQIEQVTGQWWLEALCRTWNFSEYTLYGTYIDRVLKERSGHYSDPVQILNSYYAPASLSERELQQFLAATRPEHVAIMISAKAHMSVERYEALIGKL
jgi:hypothetical protein